jgi:hypothetical protein
MKEIPNPSKLLRIKPVKYKTDKKMKGIPPPLPNNCFFITLVGKPASGKSTILVNLVSKGGPYYRKFHKVYIFSPSLLSSNIEDSPFLSLPSDQKYTDLDDLEDIIQDLQDSNSEERCLMIFDDIQGEIAQKDNVSIFLNMANNRRHIGGGVSVILCTQVYNQINLKIRKSISTLFFFTSRNQKEIDSVHREYLSHLSDQELKTILKFCWRDKHDFILINTYASTETMLHRNFNKLIF